MPPMLMLLASMLLAPAEIEREEPWSCYFGGQRITLHYRLPGMAGATPVGWAFAIDGRVVARREIGVSRRSDRPAAEVSLDLPQARPGVVIAASMAITVPGVGELVHPLWIFPQNPFEGRVAEMGQAGLAVFDPVGKTSKVLQSVGLPFRQLRDVAGIARTTSGVILVGEGIAFREWRSLATEMVAAAARGVRVLSLAPASGTILLPGFNRSGPQPIAMHFGGIEVIRGMDKRFDVAWAPDGKAHATGLAVRAERAGIGGEFAPGGEWPWADLRFGDSGRLTFCTFEIVVKWNSGPTPRYLLAEILRRLASGTAIKTL